MKATLTNLQKSEIITAAPFFVCGCHVHGYSTTTLRARGVCSRIPHFAAIAVLCSLPVHSAPNKLPDILTYRLRQIKQNLVASLVASCEWLCRSLFRIRTQFREEVHPKRVRQLRRRAEREVHVLVQHLRDVRSRHFHPLRQFRLRHPQLLHPQQYPPQKRRSYPIYRFHIFPAVIMGLQWGQTPWTDLHSAASTYPPPLIASPTYYTSILPFIGSASPLYGLSISPVRRLDLPCTRV